MRESSLRIIIFPELVTGLYNPKTFMFAYWVFGAWYFFLFRYVLMCIHFLQQRRPAILPCLQVCISILLVYFRILDWVFFSISVILTFQHVLISSLMWFFPEVKWIGCSFDFFTLIILLRLNRWMTQNYYHGNPETFAGYVLRISILVSDYIIGWCSLLCCQNIVFSALYGTWHCFEGAS